ncbi:profilin [Mactra antiquata]
MSWDAHVNSLMSGPGMKCAGLFGMDGNPWATSAGFKPTQAEVARLIKLVQGKDIGGESITLCGQKYMFRSPADEGLLTVLSLGGDEKYVCNVCQSTRGVLLGVSLASVAGASREYLDKYKNYLKGIGY